MEEEMAIIRFTERPGYGNPWVEFDRIRRSFDRFARDYYNGSDTQYDRATVFPPINIYEENERLIVKAEIPGVKPKDLNISLEGETLAIKGTRKPNDAKAQNSFHRREIERGSFSRALTLPLKVDPDNVSAIVKNGILTITLNKASDIQPRQIRVSSE